MNHPRHRDGSVPVLLLATLVLGAFLFMLGGNASMPGLTLSGASPDPGMAGTFVLQAAACLVTGLFLSDPAG